MKIVLFGFASDDVCSCYSNGLWCQGFVKELVLRYKAMTAEQRFKEPRHQKRMVLLVFVVINPAIAVFNLSTL